MLRSIGASQKQIKNMALTEGLLLGIIAIPSGSILGLIITYLLTIIVNLIAQDGNLLVSGTLLYYKFNILPFLIATILGFIMIYFSTLSARRKASKVSPIQNIRNSDEITNSKKLKVPKIITNIFKIGGTLSYKNLKRSKKKYRVTVISLTISILVFIIVSTFLEYGIRTVKEQYLNINYNVSANMPYNEEVDINKLIKLDKSHIQYYPKYEKLGVMYLKDISHILENNIIIQDFCSIYDDKAPNNCAGEIFTALPINTYFYDDDSFKDLAKKLKVDYNYLKDKVILINITKDPMSNKTRYITLTNYKKGDNITINGGIKADLSWNYQIGLVTDYRPWGLEDYYTNSPMFIMNEKYFNNNKDLEVQNIYYESEYPDKLVDSIEKINKNINTLNIDEEVKESKSMILIFSIFIYGFIIVVSLIGITSVFNTINSNMYLRKKEFALLKSIGMTKKEFNNMILLESVFYSLKSLLYGIILGIIGSIIVYKIFADNTDFGYIFPLKAIIVSIILVIILVYTIMKYSINKINKQNIIETIRNENI